MFTLPSMDSVIVHRIWDIFIANQMTFDCIIKVSYLIFVRHSQELLHLDFMEMINFSQSAAIMSIDGMDDHELIERTSKLQLNEKSELYLQPIRRLKHITSDNGEDTESAEHEDGQSVLDVLWSYIFWGF